MTCLLSSAKWWKKRSSENTSVTCTEGNVISHFVCGFLSLPWSMSLIPNPTEDVLWIIVLPGEEQEEESYETMNMFSYFYGQICFGLKVLICGTSDPSFPSFVMFWIPDYRVRCSHYRPHLLSCWWDLVITSQVIKVFSISLITSSDNTKQTEE